jgi:hypothetical protein
MVKGRRDREQNMCDERELRTMIAQLYNATT